MRRYVNAWMSNKCAAGWELWADLILVLFPEATAEDGEQVSSREWSRRKTPRQASGLTTGGSNSENGEKV